MTSVDWVWSKMVTLIKLLTAYEILEQLHNVDHQLMLTLVYLHLHLLLRLRSLYTHTEA